MAVLSRRDGLAGVMAVAAINTDGVPAVLIGSKGMLGEAREALAAIGGQGVAELDWDQVAAGHGLPGSGCLLALEAQGVDEKLLAAALPRIDAGANALGAPIVISFDRSAIDVVAATLLGPRTQMLCEPSLADRTLALALAAQAIGHDAISDTTYEGEAARLKRLNEEVARIAEVLSRLSRRDTTDLRRDVPAIADRQFGFNAEPMPDVVIDAGEIRRAIRGRRLRDQFFGTGLFEEPGWDMILDLFAAELEGVRVSVSSLCIAAAVAPTTALRWVSKLTESGLFERQPDPFDRRRAYMELSERASRAIRDYVGALRRAGLSLA